MGLAATSLRLGSLAAWLGLLVSLLLGLDAGAAGPEETTKLGCGVNSLYILLRLEGRPVSLDRLDSVLPPRRPDGSSMAELTAGARLLGLRLEGVRFAKGNQTLEMKEVP